jgi:hypothetical protein
MTEHNTAFSLHASPDEKTDALGQLQQAHLPTASELIPHTELAPLIDYIKAQAEESEFAKAMNPSVIPFPSDRLKHNEPGMKSYYLDEWQLSLQGDYYERPGGMNFNTLRAMAEQTPALSAVIATRARQVQRFCRIAETGLDQPGFEIRHADKKHQLKDGEHDKIIRPLQKFFEHCGWEADPRKRKSLHRDSFAQFMGKASRDTLIMDSLAIETEYKKDSKKGMDGFYCVDGATIRLCTEDGYRGDDAIFALQVVDGRVATPYTYMDLIYEPRNPRSDLRVAGYGYSETELLVRIVTGFLNAMTYNLKGFDSNAIPKGMLHLSGNYSQKDIDAFKRYWNSMVKGINNTWALPVMVSKDQESRAAFEKFGIEFNEMYFAKWMTFLVSIICAIYGMSPSEINFDSFTGGSTSALSGSDTAEKLAASKDSGLRPLLSYFENLFSDYIVSVFLEDYCFRWTGLDPEDQQRKFETRKLILTVNEMRAEEGYDKLDGPLGAALLNPSLIGPWMQLQPEGEEPQNAQPEGEPQGDLQKANPLLKNAKRDSDGLPFGSQPEPLNKSYGLPPLTDENWWTP